jgi:hypothetical protein
MPVRYRPKSSPDKLKSIIGRILQGLAYRAASERELLASKELPEAALVMFARESGLAAVAAADLR